MKISLEINQLKFFYKYENNKLPKYFDTLPLYPNREIHNYNTRRQNYYHILNTTHSFAKKAFRHTLITTLNNTTNMILDKVYTHSQSGFIE